MADLRFDPIRGYWVAIADERGKRPVEYDVEVKSRPDVPCPFCPGHEHLTPEPILTVPDGAGGWRMRLLPNRFPTVVPDAHDAGPVPAWAAASPARGHHEVLVESADHGARHGDYSISEIARILHIYRARLRDLMAKDGCTSVAIFANVGFRAGATLSHPHSQIVSLPIVPQLPALEAERCMAYYEEQGECVFCRRLTDELREGARVVEEADGFVTLAPWASRFPYETRILPTTHRADFGEIPDTDIDPLARVLSKLLRAQDIVLERPPYNLVLHSVPRPAGVDRTTLATAYHWYLEIIPRMGSQAGMEWGSGLNINSTPPERAATLLRDAFGAVGASD